MDGSIVFEGEANIHPTEHMLPWTHAPKSILQTASQSVQPILPSSRQKVPILYNGPPFCPPNCYFVLGSRHPSNTWFIWPTRVDTLNDMSIGSAALQAHDRERQTTILHL